MSSAFHFDYGSLLLVCFTYLNFFPCIGPIRSSGGDQCPVIWDGQRGEDTAEEEEELEKQSSLHSQIKPG